MSVLRNKNKAKNKYANSSIGFIADQNLPDSFKVGREGDFQLQKIERDLFSDLEEKESGNYIISGLPEKITKQDFSAFTMAIWQSLYNQSYQSGNLDTNSGLTKTRAPKTALFYGDSNTYQGDIKETEKNLCRYGYGVDEPDARQRKAMATIIDTMHETPVVITFPDGAEREITLCAKMEKFKGTDGAVTYSLHLHPLFCRNVTNNFAEYPQDIMKRLADNVKKITLAHRLLLRLLGKQDKRRPFIRTTAQLLADLELEDAYKKDRTRTEKKIEDAINVMVKMDVLSKYSVERSFIRGKQFITKFTFYLNSREKLLHHENKEQE